MRALGRFRRLADRFRHLAGLAVAEADAALLVADDDERGEAEAPAALHDLGDAVDVDQPVDEFAVALVAIMLAALSWLLLPCAVSLARAAGPLASNAVVGDAARRSRSPGRLRGRRRPAP